MTPERTADHATAKTAPYSPAPANEPAARPVSRFPTARYLASGGLGDVFAADAELPREVALKQLRDGRCHDEAARAEFVREARLTGSLEHPGVVPVYSLGRTHDGHPFYAMRLIGGRTLRAAIDEFHASAPTRGRFAALGFRQILGRFVSVCQAVEYAHSRGVIHRDLKPDNIMVGAFGETLVIDWGLAKRVGEPDETGSHEPTDDVTSRTRTGVIRGTLAYMAPEQAAGRNADLGPACDVFALGGVLFTLLTGELPAGDDRWDGTLSRLREGRFRTPRDARPDVPAPLDAVCRKAMAFRPNDRYASAADLAADCERWLADEPVTARRAPLPERAARWARKRPAAVSGVGASLAVGLVALAVSLTVVDGKNTELRASESLASARFDMAKEAVEKYLAAVTEDTELRERGLYALRKRLLETSMPFFERLTSESGETPEARSAQAAAHLRRADIAEEAADPDSARRDYESAKSILERVAAERPEVPEYRAGLARAHYRLGKLLSDRADPAGPELEYRAALALQERLAAEVPGEPKYRAELAKTHTDLGVLLSDGDSLPEAEREYQAALAIQAPLTAEQPNVAEYRAESARVRLYMAVLKGKFMDEEAVRMGGDSHLHRAEGERPAKTARCFTFSVKLSNLHGKDSMELFQPALAEFRRLVSDFPGKPEYRSGLAKAHRSLGWVFGANWVVRNRAERLFGKF